MKKNKNLAKNKNQTKNSDNHVILKGIEKLTEKSTVFQFLHDEESLYSLKNVKEKY
jgi:hypothetical protein